LAWRLAGSADAADRADIICRYHIWHSFGIRLPASTLGRVAIQRGEPLGLCEVIHRVGIEKWIERLDWGASSGREVSMTFAHSRDKDKRQVYRAASGICG
jgi:hypothetical protein